jgi:hypothetical protein
MVLPYQFVKRGIVYVLSIHDVAPAPLLTLSHTGTRDRSAATWRRHR